MNTRHLQELAGINNEIKQLGTPFQHLKDIVKKHFENDGQWIGDEEEGTQYKQHFMSSIDNCQTVKEIWHTLDDHNFTDTEFLPLLVDFLDKFSILKQNNE